MRNYAFLAGFAFAALSSGGAFAADLVQPAPAVAPAPVAYDWTGFYAGVFAGVGASTQNINSSGVTVYSLSGGGGMVGAQAGYDASVGGAVLGIYGDLAWSNIGGDLNFGGVTALSSRIDWLGTVQGKVGVPVLDRTLLYVHGGYAYAHETQSLFGSTGANQGHNGFVIGLGAEYALSSNLTINTEYGYYQFADTQLGNVGGLSTVSEQTTFNAVKVGLNYKF